MLSDTEIKKLIFYCNMINKPLIKPYDEKRLGPVSYDIFTRMDHEDEESLCLVSMETFNLPRDVLGLVSLRSNTTKRLSPIIASFSQLVDPGYKGRLIFKIYKTKYPIGDMTNLFQIMFIYIDGEVETAYNERKSSTAMNRKGFK